MKRLLRVLLIVMLFSLLGCKNQTVKVSFNTNSETIIDDIRVEKGGLIEEPVSPKKRGYYIEGWYDGDQKWDFSNKVTKNITLTAKWEYQVTYFIYENTAIVDRYNKELTNYEILDEYDGYPTTTLNASAFSDCKKMVSIELPDSLKQIGGSAFYNCTSLTSINIPTKVEAIESSTFYNCKSLETINLNKGLKSIGHHAFYNCSSLSSIVIPETVETISTESFIYCPSLKTIIVDSNNKIYDSRNNCEAIIEITSNALLAGCKNTIIPEGIETIRIGAFQGSSIKNLYIPKDVISIESMAFADCSELESISVNPNNTKYNSKNNCNAIVDEYNYIILGCKNTTIDDSIFCINQYAFYGCTGLTSVRIPKKLELVIQGAFINCSSLESIIVDSENTVLSSGNNSNAIIQISSNSLVLGCKNTVIPDGISSIRDNAFDGCKDLKTITIPDSITSIGDFAFRNCKSLTSISIPENVSSIGMFAFHNCSSLVSINIPSRITKIYDNAFYSCSSLSSITLPEGIESIGTYAFAFCSSLKQITIPGSVQRIGDLAFNNCSSLTTVNILSGTKRIGSHAFSYCSSLKNITIPNTVELIGMSAFAYCSSLESITLPDSVRDIYISAFMYCPLLDSIILPSNLSQLQSMVFRNCDSLKSIVIPGSVQRIDDYAFFESKNLENIYYFGSSDDYSKLNSKIEYGTVYFYSENKPKDKGTYWHYQDGLPRKWE